MSCVESSDSDVGVYVKNKRYRFMTGSCHETSETDDEVNTTRFDSTQFESSQSECSSQSESDDSDKFYGKRARLEEPYHVYRYVPRLKISYIRRMGYKYNGQTYAIWYIASLGVNERFCICTGQNEDKATTHMRNSFIYFKRVLSPRRFLYVLFSFIYIFSMRQKYTLYRKHKYECSKCTMVEWWSKSSSYLDMIMYLYNQYVSPERCTQFKDIVFTIERYLLKKHSDTFIPFYFKSLREYMTRTNAHMFVDKVMYLLIKFGAKMCNGRNFESNLLLQLLYLCSNFMEFDDMLDEIQRYLPETLYQMAYLKTLRTCLIDDEPLLHTIYVDFVWNKKLSCKIMHLIKNQK